MQHKICLLLPCIIAILFVELNEGTTTKSTTTKSTTTKNITTKKPPVAEKKKLPTQGKPTILGGHTSWETKIKPAHQKIFDDYKKITLKKLQETHKVSDSFVPKPDKSATQIVGGINYLYLVKLPTNKYAFISILHRPWSKSHYGKEENVQIRTQTYELNDKTV